MLKRVIKGWLKIVTKGLTSFRAGRYFLQQMLEISLNYKIKVNHGGAEMHFTSPNHLARFRSESFSDKEPETLNWIEGMPSNSVFWDVGANVGLYSVYAAKRNNIRVIAFEPSVFNLELLARNIFLNGLQGLVTIIPVALSDSLGPCQFKMSSTSWGGALSSFGQDFDQHGAQFNSIFEYQTMGMTMDEAILLLDIPAPRFIKIDVDGIEHLILRGGANTLKNVESVMVEIDDCFTAQAEEAERHLLNAGMTLLRKCGGTGTQYNQWWIRKRA